MKNLDSEVLKEIDYHIDNSKTTSVNKDYEKLINEILGKPSSCERSILKALKACVDAKTVDKYDEKEFYKKYIKPITTKSMFERMRGMFGREKKGGRKSKKSSRGKKKTRRKKKKSRGKRKTRGKKKKTRGKKRR